LGGDRKSFRIKSKPIKVWSVPAPEFYQEDLRPWHSVNVRFRNQEDFDRFKKLMEQEITPKQKALWFPFAPFRRAAKFNYIDES
jgi:hypothetical protein